MHTTELFTVRLWREQLNETHTEWRGKIQHIGSGETRYFRSLDNMMEFMSNTLSNFKNDEKPELAGKVVKNRFQPEEGAEFQFGVDQGQTAKSSQSLKERPSKNWRLISTLKHWPWSASSFLFNQIQRFKSMFRKTSEEKEPVIHWLGLALMLATGLILGHQLGATAYTTSMASTEALIISTATLRRKLERSQPKLTAM
jgi:hypothetical protein